MAKKKREEIVIPAASVEGDLPTTTTEERRGRGRPSPYKPEYAAIARAMCKLGATDAEIAEELEVTVQTIHQWQVTHKDFSESLRIRKNECDDRIERRLAERAMGYTYQSEEVHVLKDGTVMRIPVTKHVLPDPGAAKMWLSARRAKQWHAAAQQQSVNINIDASQPAMSDLELARRMAVIMASAAGTNVPELPDSSENPPMITLEASEVTESESD